MQVLKWTSPSQTVSLELRVFTCSFPNNGSFSECVHELFMQLTQVSLETWSEKTELIWVMKMSCKQN